MRNSFLPASFLGIKRKKEEKYCSPAYSEMNTGSSEINVENRRWIVDLDQSNARRGFSFVRVFLFILAFSVLFMVASNLGDETMSNGWINYMALDNEELLLATYFCEEKDIVIGIAPKTEKGGEVKVFSLDKTGEISHLVNDSYNEDTVFTYMENCKLFAYNGNRNQSFIWTISNNSVEVRNVTIPDELVVSKESTLVSINNTILVIGGFKESKEIIQGLSIKDEVNVNASVVNLNVNDIEQAKSLTSRCGQSAAGIENKTIYVYGGRDCETNKTVESLITLSFSEDLLKVEGKLLLSSSEIAKDFDRRSEVYDYLDREKATLLITQNSVLVHGGVSKDKKSLFTDLMIKLSKDGKEVSCGIQEGPFCLQKSIKSVSGLTSNFKSSVQTAFIKDNEIFVFKPTQSGVYFGNSNEEGSLVSHSLAERVDFLPEQYSGYKFVLVGFFICCCSCICCVYLTGNLLHYSRNNRNLSQSNNPSDEWIRQIFGISNEGPSVNGLNKALLKKLPKATFSQIRTSNQQLNRNTNDCCCICLSEFEDIETLTVLPCTHIFHQPCIESWLNKNNQCPLCKQNVNSGAVDEMILKIKNENTQMAIS